MIESVKVVGDDHGNVIVKSVNNPEYGYIKIEQEAPTFKQGWLNFNRRVAIIKGKVKDLQKLNYQIGSELPGKIVIVESLRPFSNEADRDFKIAGATGVICRVDDEPIYRQTFYTQNLNEPDIFIQHTNTDEIKDVFNAQRAINILRTRKINGEENPAIEI
jgi:hypothetical protein